MQRRNWLAHLWREWTVERRRPIAPAFAKPTPEVWSEEEVTAAWLGHSTVLIEIDDDQKNSPLGGWGGPSPRRFIPPLSSAYARHIVYAQ